MNDNAQKTKDEMFLNPSSFSNNRDFNKRALSARSATLDMSDSDDDEFDSTQPSTLVS